MATIIATWLPSDRHQAIGSDDDQKAMECSWEVMEGTRLNEPLVAGVSEPQLSALGVAVDGALVDGAPRHEAVEAEALCGGGARDACELACE